MTDNIQIFSYFFTNELRLLFGLFLIARPAGFSLKWKTLLLAGAAGCLVNILQAVLSLPSVVILAFEVLIITAIAWYCRREKLNLFLFLAIFYEIGVGLWDFLSQAGLGILLHSEKFVRLDTLESLAGIWLIRSIMLGTALLLAKQQEKLSMHLISAMIVLGLFGTVTLSEQTILPLQEDQTGTWIILSMVLLFSALFYRLIRQREMELEIAQLKQERTDILERDYQTLNRTYADNAKLYHDLHNHIETIYQCLTQGDIPEAVKYCEDLRTPIRDISHTVWTGDKTVDYLISSKIALANQQQIRTKVNIEYPHNTNIRSIDLTTILGNLLDNALEAATMAPDELRFLILTIRRINDMLIIKVQNGYGDTPTQENGKLQTSKTDKTFHGWGLKSVQTAADRYDGAVSTDYQDGIFQSVVTLSFKPVKTESSLF